MPDISKCSNEDCKKKWFCFRYTAAPSMRQSYAAFDHNDCNYQIKHDCIHCGGRNTHKMSCPTIKSTIFATN